MSPHARPNRAIDAVRRRTVGLIAAVVAGRLGIARAQRGADPQREIAATVLSSAGSTILTRPGLLATPIRNGTELRSGDRVRTGEDGALRMRFVDDSVVVLQPRTTFLIQEFAYGAQDERSHLQLLKGAMRFVSGAIGRRNRDDFRLRTPTATIGIRGTEFTAEENDCPGGACPGGARPGLLVGVVRGRVVVTTEAGSVEVPEGAAVYVRDSAALPEFAAQLPQAPAPRPRPAPTLRPGRRSDTGPTAPP